ncbi:uncharacterized protein LOC126823620 isoform X2 [Patella vulgata]|nr:uncharacterized protein LOC126823620 isoform X2 [Patella vulgata]
MKDSVMLPPHHHRYDIDTKFTLGNATLSLTITNVSVEDAGIYRCILDLLNVHQDIKLIVNGDAGFEWIPSTQAPIKKTLNQDIELTWTYRTSKRIHKIIIYRTKDEESSPENVGVWTVGNGYKPDPSLSTDVHFSKNFTNDGGKVSIKLIRAIYKDFDLTYFCHVYCEGSFDDKQGIELTSHRPKCRAESKHIEAREKEAAVFKWSFEYPYGAVAVMFWLETTNVVVSYANIQRKYVDDIGFWYMDTFELYSHFKGKFSFSKSVPDIDGKEWITLTLRRVTRQDFNATYFCKVVHGDGQLSQCKVILTQKFDSEPDDVKGDETRNQTSKEHTPSLGLIIPFVVITTVVIILVLVLAYLIYKMRNRKKKRCTTDDTDCADGVCITPSNQDVITSNTSLVTST